MNRTKTLQARVNRTEAEALKNLAQFEKVKTSEALRLAIREATRRRGIWPGPVVAELAQVKVDS